MPAEPQRQVWLLHRLRLHRNIFKIPIASLKTSLRFGPEQLHNLHRLGEAGHAPFARVTEDIFMRPKMTATEPNSHNRATAAHDIQCRVGFRQLQRISQGQQDDRSPQPQLSRDRRHVTEQSYRFQHAETTDDSLLEPEAVVAESFRFGDEGADMLHVDGPIKEDLRNLDTAR